MKTPHLVAVAVALVLVVAFIIIRSLDTIGINKYNDSLEGEYSAIVEVNDREYYLVEYNLDDGLLTLNKYYFSGSGGKIKRGYRRVINGDFTITYKGGLIREIKR